MSMLTWTGKCEIQGLAQDDVSWMWVVWRWRWGSVMIRRRGLRRWEGREGTRPGPSAGRGDSSGPITGSPSASPAAAAAWRCPQPRAAVVPSHSAAPTAEPHLRCALFPWRLPRAEVAEGGKESSGERPSIPPRAGKGCRGEGKRAPAAGGSRGGRWGDVRNRAARWPVWQKKGGYIALNLSNIPLSVIRKMWFPTKTKNLLLPVGVWSMVFLPSQDSKVLKFTVAS